VVNQEIDKLKALSSELAEKLLKSAEEL